jgi:hypothetical protein
MPIRQRWQLSPSTLADASAEGLSNRYVDVKDGHVPGQYRPWQGAAADVFFSGSCLCIPAEFSTCPVAF